LHDRPVLAKRKPRILCLEIKMMDILTEQGEALELLTGKKLCPSDFGAKKMWEKKGGPAPTLFGHDS
jgi:hypothetical protein